MKPDRETVDADTVDQLSTGGERVILQITPSGADQGACTVGQVKGKMPRAGARDRDSSLSALDRTRGNAARLPRAALPKSPTDKVGIFSSAN